MKANKSLGQNFLQDRNIISKIVESIDLTKNDLVIEIGPGQGALTKALKEKGVQLLAFEIDERMHEFLDLLEDRNTKVIYGDILNVDLKEYLGEKKFNKLYVIANLPYYITTPIIEKLLNYNTKFDSMVVMVQNEVADRFSAKCGTKDYGYMTVLINAFYEAKKLFIVKNTCFKPVPKVDSAVVKFDLKNDANKLLNVDKFKNLVSLSFAHKRKTLKNNLPKDIWDKVEKYLIEKNINLDVRAEGLSVDNFIDISNLI